MKGIDLHIHSTASDGSYTPAEIVRYAAKKELSAIALTDHDTVHGIPEALKTIEEEKLPVKLIPGIEISSRYEDFGLNFEVHILGYGIDYKNERFNRILDEIKGIRNRRNAEMIARLREQGLNISIDAIEQKYHGSTITRMHIANYLYETGMVINKEVVFKKYIGQGCPCYVPRMLVSPMDAFGLIKDFGGIPVLAHPVQYKLTPGMYDSMIEKMKEMGLQGIEAIYSSNTAADERYFKRLAEDHGLFITGGSDFHGLMKPKIDMGSGFGSLFIPEDLLKNIEK